MARFKQPDWHITAGRVKPEIRKWIWTGCISFRTKQIEFLHLDISAKLRERKKIPMIVPINGGGVCASRAIPSVRHICFGVVNSLPPPPPSSIRSPPFGPLHSLSPLVLAIRIHRCSTQTTLTPSFYENKTTTAIAETNKQKRRVRQAIFIHDAFDAPGKFTVRRIRIFPGFKIFFYFYGGSQFLFC